MISTVVDYDFSKRMVLKPPIKNKRGSPTGYISEDTPECRQKPTFQLSGPGKAMHVTFDPKSYDEENKNVTLSLTLEDEAVKTAVEKLDEIIIGYLHTNQKFFFRKEDKTMDMIRAMHFRSSIVQDDEGKYLPRLQCKIDTTTPDKVEVYRLRSDAKKMSKCTYNDIKRGDLVIPIVSINSIWCISNRAGFSYNLERILIKNQEKQCMPLFNMGMDCATPVLEEEEEEENKAFPVSNGKRKQEVEEQEHDGSTVIIDPVTLQPISKKQKS
jgi:hypothetical protein